tara:strand:- start:10 stop:507 length:498 start_codon:yes stop_codon:yes gene_type:complete
MKLVFKIAFAVTFISSCGIYSFSGASIPSQAKSVSIDYFKTSATNSPSILNRILTESLKDLVLNQTDLDLIENDGDLKFNGKITKYEISPVAINSDESVGKSRLTISIIVKYQNIFDDKLSFENSFSHYSDFESSENFSDIEEQLIELIKNVILEDVFNKAFVNW